MFRSINGIGYFYLFLAVPERKSISRVSVIPCCHIYTYITEPDRVNRPALGNFTSLIRVYAARQI
jgi:hypothetical protein